MGIFIFNIALGFLLAAEFGQVSVEVFRRALSNGFKEGFLTVLGAVTGDLLYLILTMLGVIIIFNDPSFLRILWILGAMALFYIGTSGVQDYIEKAEIRSDTERRKMHPYLIGFILAFVHPLNLIWWATILSPIILKNMLETSWQIAFLNALGIHVGVLLWLVPFSFVVSISRTRLRKHHLRSVSLASSIMLMVFALWFGWHAF